MSADGVFSDARGNLADLLQDDVDQVGGKVELARDFGAWLLDQLPWQVETLPKAVKISRDAEFYDFYLKSDFKSELAPELADLGFDQTPYAVNVDEVEWDGHFESVSEAAVPPDLTLVEYEIGQAVRFTAVFDREVQAEGDWEVSRLGAAADGRSLEPSQWSFGRPSFSVESSASVSTRSRGGEPTAAGRAPTSLVRSLTLPNCYSTSRSAGASLGHR